MLKDFLSTINTYKELVVLVSLLVGTTLFVRDYFATKNEVGVLQCQMQNSIDILESRMNTDELTSRLMRLKAEVQEGKGKIMATTVGSGTSEWLIAINTEIDKLEKEISAQEALRRRAAEDVAPGGTCVNMGKRK